MTNPPTEKKTSKRKALKIVLIVLLCLFALMALLVGGAFFLHQRGQNSMVGQQGELSVPSSLVDDADPDGRHVTYKGQKYVLNDHLVSVLFMGVDKYSIDKDFGYGENGQADSLFVATMDTETGDVRIIPLSREIMTDVKMYSVDGTYVGTEKTQLCLAYAYGNSGESSCRNVVESVRYLLYGMDIDAYAAIDLDGVSALTDAVGGIEVKAAEDMELPSNVTVKKGEPVTLTGRQAVFYIQSRGNDVNANNRRLQRQRQFLEAFFIKAKNMIRNDITCIATYYTVAKPYIVTDLDLSKIIFLGQTSLTASGTSMTYLNVTGETVMGEKHVEFYADPDSLYEAVLQAFYLPENN